MNFDGKAIVKNTTVRMFHSEHGYAFVENYKELGIKDFNVGTNKSVAFSALKSLQTYPNEEFVKQTLYMSGLVPYTCHVIQDGNNIQALEPQTFMNVKDCTVQKEQEYIYNPKTLYIAKVQPTNIRYNPKSAIVIDNVLQETQTPFTGTTVNVYSKMEVVIPDKPTDYSDMSIVIQKNSFVEIKIPEGVIDVVNLPEELMYLPGYIKGTFTQSGEYNIKIKYSDGEQILNIIVPYYQRLL